MHSARPGQGERENGTMEKGGVKRDGGGGGGEIKGNKQKHAFGIPRQGVQGASVRGHGGVKESEVTFGILRP